MEASQASEAGSIPVARSTTARPRAGRLCYARFTPTVYRMRRDNRRKTLPTQAGCPLSRYKTRPAHPARRHFRNKTRPARPKLPHLARFPLAGRVFSRYRQQQARYATGTGTKLTLHEPRGATCGTKLAQREPRGGIFGIKLALLAQNGLIWRVLLLLGEFCPVFVANKPSRESFLPHKPQHQHRIERNNTPTQHSKPRGETFTAPAPHTNPRGETFSAPARHKQPKITHFHHAGANFLSQHPPPTQHTPTPRRTLFQPPAPRPIQPTVACNSNSAKPHTNMETAEFQRADFKP